MRCLLVFLLCLVAVLSEGQTPAASPEAQPPAATLEDARKLIQRGRIDEAVAELQKLTGKGVSRELGIAYYKKADYPNAIRSLKLAVEENKDDNEAVQLLGLSYYLSGNTHDAIPYLERVQTWYASANVDASYILGISYIHEKDYAHARVAFSKMFGVGPESAASYLFMARMLLRQEYDPVAEEYAQRVVALDPKLPLAHYMLGELHLYKSRVADAVEDFKQELTLNPAYAAGYYRLADAYARLQKYDDAERALQRSIWLDSTSTGAYILLGKVLQKKGEPLLAQRALIRAANMDPNNATTHHLLAQAYRDLGSTADAEREFKIAEQLQNAQTSSAAPPAQ